MLRLPTHGTSTSGDTRTRRDAPVLYVVDDDLSTVELLCEVGRERGWQVRGFTLLEELTHAIDERKPTLIILDDDLPDGRGGDLAIQLRRNSETADIRVLVCTAAHPMRQAEIGAFAPVVAKPFVLDQLERFLEAAWQRHHGGGRLDEAG
jgi:DNA-binding response OmpR family regulator